MGEKQRPRETGGAKETIAEEDDESDDEPDDGSSQAPGTTADDEQALEEIKQRIQHDRGLDVHQYKATFLRRRITGRVRARKLGGFRDYLKILLKEPVEYRALLDRLAINVTDFYRNPATWHAVEDRIFPEVFAGDRAKTIRFWSAGCATGEEAYTMAIAAREFLGEAGTIHRIVVRGTDLDEDALQKARRGLFPPSSLRYMPRVLIPKYFTERETERGPMFQLADAIRSMVVFARHDLISGPKQRYFDCIMCRNVVIYFTRDEQERLFGKLYEALNEGGFLVLGKTETLQGGPRDLFEPVDSTERVYRRPLA